MADHKVIVSSPVDCKLCRHKCVDLLEKLVPVMLHQSFLSRACMFVTLDSGTKTNYPCPRAGLEY